jgi:proline iminopeptidase
MALRNGFVTSNRLKLYYEIEGKGEPLVLLNGGPGFSHEYLQPLRALAGDVQLVFFDQRGTGRSDKADPREYTIEANVQDVEQLRRELHLESILLLGHSWGGMLAQAYVLRYPKHVSKLILADTVSSIEELNTVLARMRNSVPESTQAVYDKHEQEGLYKNSDRYPEEYQIAVDAAYKPIMIDGPMPEHLKDMFSKVAYDVYRVMWGEESEFRVTGTLANFDVRHQLYNIRIPVLVIVGAKDMPTITMAEHSVRAMPNARLQIFEYSHHFPFIEEADKFLDVVREFINPKS